MGKLKLKTPTTPEEKEKVEELQEKAKYVIKTKTGKFYTNDFTIDKNGWVNFIPEVTEREPIVEKHKMFFPPQQIIFIDPPVEADFPVEWFIISLGVLGGIIALKRLR